MVYLIGLVLAQCTAASSAASTDLQLAQSSRLFGADPTSSMRIDIKPDTETNIIKRNSGRVIPVAIMGSPALEVVSINPRTISLEGVDLMLIGKSDKSLCKQIDIDADGHTDLVCDVRTTGFRVKPGSYTIRLKAETYDKTSLRGTDYLRIVDN
ncbi:MAG: hypothetical protein [Olavius algarvensis Gamma 3 endosymbiont]|nr:MAG: hypothetical protein [Olavius algarvensis Gamma 3 endosymbiont]